MGTRIGLSAAVLGALAALTPPAVHAEVNVAWTTVGDPGNPDNFAGLGAVPYTYRIAKYEVTNGQYAAFLNAKAASDPLELYNDAMDFDAVGGITRFGPAGGYSYQVKGGFADKPVVFVGRFDAMRFANWMQNGQGAGDTESGAYTLLGGTPIPTDGNGVTRNPGAVVALPTGSEWSKAAYYDPAKGGTGGYWFYPTRSDTAPAGGPPPGGSNGANFGFGVGGLTDVGAYGGSASAYGTFDQGGNAWEWIELPSAYLYGGSWRDSDGFMAMGVRLSGFPFDNTAGFRLVSVPEPSGLACIALAALARRTGRKPPRRR